MIRLLRMSWGLMRRRPVASAATLLPAAAVLVALGVHLWALRDFQGARNALDKDRLADAADDLSFCLSVWPASAETHLLAVRIDRMNGDYGDAETQLDACRRLQSGPTAATEREALLLRAERGELDQVRDGLLTAAEQDPGGGREILEGLARASMREMRYAAAEALLERCLARWPDDVRALDWRGWVRERLDQPDKAAKDYLRALELDPGRAEVRMRLALYFLDHSNPTQAEAQLKVLLASDPNRPDALLGLARCRFWQGRSDEARALLDRVLAVRPEEPTALLYKGKLAMQADPPRPEEAETYYRRALKAAPNEAEIHNALSACLRAEPGRTAEADGELARFTDLVAVGRRIQALLLSEGDQPSKNAAPAYELGKLNLDVGNDDQAFHWLHIAEQRDPGHRPTHILLSQLYAKDGETDEAARERALGEK